MSEISEIRFPDQPGYFENRTIIQVFATFDTPTIYTFLSLSKDFYFAYQYDEDSDEQSKNDPKSTWFFIPTDLTKVKKLIQGEITLREFFRLSLYGYLVTMRGTEVIGNACPLKYTDFPTEYLPAEGVKLQRSTSDLVITLKKAGLSPFSVPDQVLTDLLSDFRKSVKRIMRGLKETTEDFAACHTTPKYALTGINWGSLELTLTPIVRNDLFTTSIETIHKVVNDPNSPDVSDQIRNLVKATLYTITPKGRGKYNFDSISFSGSLAFESQLFKSIDFSLTSAETELYKKEAALNQPRTIKLTGIMYAFDMEDDFFRLNRIESNDFDINEIKCNFEHEVFETLGQGENPWDLMKKKVVVECEYISKSKSVDVISVIQA